MTHEQFCYWLQGWFELNTTIDHRESATPETMLMIKEHLQLTFNKVTGQKPSGLKRDKMPDWNPFSPGTTSITSPKLGEYITTCQSSNETCMKDSWSPIYPQKLCSDGNPPASC